MIGYDEDRSAAQNQALATYEVASAIRDLLYALKFSRGDGLSVAEALEVSAGKVAEALEVSAGRVAEALAEAGAR